MIVRFIAFIACTKHIRLHKQLRSFQFGRIQGDFKESHVAFIQWTTVIDVANELLVVQFATGGNFHEADVVENRYVYLSQVRRFAEIFDFVLECYSFRTT